MMKEKKQCERKCGLCGICNPDIKGSLGETGYDLRKKQELYLGLIRDENAQEWIICHHCGHAMHSWTTHMIGCYFIARLEERFKELSS